MQIVTLTTARRGVAAQVAAFVRTRLCGAETAILAISAAIAISIFLFSDPIYFSDTNSFFIYSMAISEHTVNPGAFFRQSGYPLMIAATLYPWTKSLLGILAVQAIFAALIPWLIFRILLYVSRPLAILGALLSIVTLLPYQFEMLLYPDQTQLFLDILFCYAVIRYWFESNTRNLVFIFIVYACIFFFRPPFVLLYIFLPLVVGIAARKGRKELGFAYFFKPLAVLSIAVAGLNVSASALDAYLYSRIHHIRPSMNGKIAFLNPFVNSVGIQGAFEDGKYTTILRSMLIDFFRNAPPDLRDIRNLRSQVADRFIQYQSDPELMVNAILNFRTNDTWWVLFNISDRYFGEEGDPLFMQVALEQYRLHPRIFWNVLKRGFAYYFGLRACEAPPSGFPGEYECEFYPAVISSSFEDFGFPHYGPYTGMKAYTTRLVGEKLLAEIEAPFLGYATTIWSYVYRMTILLGALLTGAGLLFVSYRVIFRGERRKLWRELPVLLVVSGVYLIYIGPMIVLTDPEFRYVSAGVLFLLMSGLVSLRMLLFQGLAAVGVQLPAPARMPSPGLLGNNPLPILKQTESAMPSSIGQIMLNLTGALGILLLFFGVAIWILSYRKIQQELNVVHVTEATYGLNCNGSISSLGQINIVKPGNVTADVANACDNKTSCNYTVTARLGDPANGCGKDFAISWQCDASHATHQVSLPGEAAFKSAMIGCPGR